MALFAVNRKTQNRGCGDGSGRWLFEEFMFNDSSFGKAAVEYGFSSHPIPPADRTLHGPIFEPEIHDGAEVVECVVFDDDGNEITVSAEDLDVLKKFVLEAFEDDKDNVIEFEGSLR